MDRGLSGCSQLPRSSHTQSHDLRSPGYHICNHAWERLGSLVQFCRRTVVEDHYWDDGDMSLVQSHGFSPILKSLRLDRSSLPLSEAFNLTCSFPLLEDLSLRSYPPLSRPPGNPTEAPPVTSPKFTGSLLLKGDTISILLWLLDLPGGLRFSKITVDCSKACLELVMKLVSRCSDTLESLCIDHFISGVSLSVLVAGRWLTFNHVPRRFWLVPFS